MKTVAIISQKGGSGKTTLAVHLATMAANSGHTVGLIDLDPQATATSWGDDRPTGPEVISGQAVRLPAMMSAAQANGTDLLMVDTAPNADQAASLAARAADVVLIPCRPARFDLEAVETTLLLTKAAGKPAYIVLNAVPPGANSIVTEATGWLVSKGASVAPHQLRQRAAFTHGVIDGRTAQEFEPKGKAAQEVEEIYMWLCGIVDMPPRGHARKAA